MMEINKKLFIFIILLYISHNMATTIIADNITHQPCMLIKSTGGGNKMIDGGFIYGQQRKVVEVIHWQCERRGVCKARVHTKGMQIINRTTGSYLSRGKNRYEDEGE